jgi:hypothetical protein
VAAGILTRDRLYGPRFRRLLPDVYAPAAAEPNLLLRSRAAAVYVGTRGVLVGYSAAEVLGASCAPADAPAEVTVPDGGRAPSGLVVHRFRPALDEVTVSPMETRIRVAIHRYGLPPPQLQFPVGPFLLDLAYPEIRLAIEYDGRDHRTAERAIRDLRREAYVTRRDWEVLRLPAATVFSPREVAIRVRRELVARGAVDPTPIGPPRW